MLAFLIPRFSQCFWWASQLTVPLGGLCHRFLWALFKGWVTALAWSWHMRAYKTTARTGGPLLPDTYSNTLKIPALFYNWFMSRYLIKPLNEMWCDIIEITWILLSERARVKSQVWHVPEVPCPSLKGEQKLAQTAVLSPFLLSFFSHNRSLEICMCCHRMSFSCS